MTKKKKKAVAKKKAKAKAKKTRADSSVTLRKPAALPNSVLTPRRKKRGTKKKKPKAKSKRIPVKKVPVKKTAVAQSPTGLPRLTPGARRPTKSNLNALKKEFLKYLRENPVTVQAACNHINRSRVAVWSWTQKDPEFAKEYEKAKAAQTSHRLEMVEDTLFKRIVKGTASPGETIFWLKRHDLKWRQADKLVQEIQGGLVILEGELDEDRLRNMTDEELRGLALSRSGKDQS